MDPKVAKIHNQEELNKALEEIFPLESDFDPAYNEDVLAGFPSMADEEMEDYEKQCLRW